MATIWSLLTVIHIIGFIIGVGAATVKLVLLIKTNKNFSFIPDYLKVSKPITKQIILGQILVTLSGIGWLFLGYDFTPVLIVKIILVGLVWIIGPVIDNVFEPKFRKLAPAAGEQPTPEFIRIQKQHFNLEVTATALFYIIIFLWILRSYF